MKLTVTIEGLASLPRFDATHLTARLQTEVERELQAIARPLDATAQRAALDRALRRISLSPRAGRGPG